MHDNITERYLDHLNRSAAFSFAVDESGLDLATLTDGQKALLAEASALYSSPAMIRYRWAIVNNQPLHITPEILAIREHIARIYDEVRALESQPEPRRVAPKLPKPMKAEPSEKAPDSTLPKTKPRAARPAPLPKTVQPRE